MCFKKGFTAYNMFAALKVLSMDLVNFSKTNFRFSYHFNKITLSLKIQTEFINYFKTSDQYL